MANLIPTRRSIMTGIAGAIGVLAAPPLVRAQEKTVKIASIAPLSGPWAR